MKNIYISSILMWDASLDEIFYLSNTHEVGGIEFWAQHFRTKDYDIKTCRNKLKQYGLNCIVHSKSWDINIASLNDEIRKASILEIKDSIDLALELGALEVTIHPPRETIMGDRKTYIELARKGLKEIISYGENNNINISLEIMEKIPKELITDSAELQEIIGEDHNILFYTLDIAHCESLEEFNKLYEELCRVSKIHISNKQGKQLHVPLAKGDYDFYELLPILENKKIPLVVEGFERGKQFNTLTENINLIKNAKENSLWL